MEAAQTQWVRIHPLVVRITHWVNVLAILVMVTSGWRIYNASPFFPFMLTRRRRLLRRAWLLPIKSSLSSRAGRSRCSN